MAGSTAISTEHHDSPVSDPAFDDIEYGPMPKHGLSHDVLYKWVGEMRYQPSWRYEADVEADIYDGNQLDSQTLGEMQERGIPPLIRNLVKPAVDAVLGTEAVNRTDVRIMPDDDGDDDFAEALNQKHHEAARTAKSDQAISDAYANEIKVGLHWVEVAREHDPFKPPYRVKSVHRREIWWDWLAKEPDVSDARYLIRKRWFDTDILKLMFPHLSELIDNMVGGWTDLDYELRESMRNTWLQRAFDIEDNYSWEELEWISPERERVCPYEVWYRKWTRGKVLKDPRSGVVVEFDKNNKFHQVAIQNRLVEIIEAVYPKVRLAWFLGPHRLADIPSPYPHNDFPYIPFWGNREDRTGAPYGLIRSMKSPQEEVNARLSKMMWLLSASRVIADEDAVHDHDIAAAEVARPNTYIKLNKDRLNQRADTFRVEDNVELSRQQFDVMMEAKQAIQDTGGVYQQMMGRDANGQSGVAIDSLVEQGMITLAEINDNYRFAKIKSHELLLSMVKEDIGRDEMEVVIGRNTGRQRSIYLNRWEEQGGKRIKTNNVAHIKTRVGLDEVPNTPTYRRQMLTRMTEITKSLSPELQAAIMDMVIESTDYPRKREMADRIRNAVGIQKPLDQMTPEEQQQVQAKMQEIQHDKQFQNAMNQELLREQTGKADQAEAEAKLKEANMEKALAQAVQIDQQTDQSDETHGFDLAIKAKALNEDDDDGVSRD